MLFWSMGICYRQCDCRKNTLPSAHAHAEICENANYSCSNNLCSHENECCASVLLHIYQHLVNAASGGVSAFMCPNRTQTQTQWKLIWSSFVDCVTRSGHCRTRTVIIIIIYVLILWTGACSVYACYQRTPWNAPFSDVLSVYFCQLRFRIIRGHVTRILFTRKVYWTKVSLGYLELAKFLWPNFCTSNARISGMGPHGD